MEKKIATKTFLLKKKLVQFLNPDDMFTGEKGKAKG